MAVTEEVADETLVGVVSVVDLEVETLVDVVDSEEDPEDAILADVVDSVVDPEVVTSVDVVVEEASEVAEEDSEVAEEDSEAAAVVSEVMTIITMMNINNKKLSKSASSNKHLKILKEFKKKK